MTDKVTKQSRYIGGINIDLAEERWKGKYVGYYSIPGIGDGPYPVFYSANPNRDLGHDNYFGLVKRDADHVTIFNASKIRDATFSAIELPSGNFLVSRSVHDYVTHGNAFLDGGPFYSRYNPDYPPTHTMTIVDGNEVYTPINKKVPVMVEEDDWKTLESCKARFDNFLNFASFPKAPYINGLTLLLNDVRDFHFGCDQPVLLTPTIPSPERCQLRHDLIAEEWKEFQEALADCDLVEIADALTDIIYVVVGTALEFGLPLDKVWHEVQSSNMAKIDPATGKAKKFPNGKVMKPEGWQPPNVARALGLEKKED